MQLGILSAGNRAGGASCLVLAGDKKDWPQISEFYQLKMKLAMSSLLESVSMIDLIGNWYLWTFLDLGWI